MATSLPSTVQTTVHDASHFLVTSLDQIRFLLDETKVNMKQTEKAHREDRRATQKRQRQDYLNKTEMLRGLVREQQATVALALEGQAGLVEGPWRDVLK